MVRHLGEHAVTKAGAVYVLLLRGRRKMGVSQDNRRLNRVSLTLTHHVISTFFKNLTVEYQHLEKEGNPVISNNKDQPERHYAK